MAFNTRPPSHQTIKGAAGAGAIPLSMARVGDRVVGVFDAATGNNASSSFEAVISKDGQVLQSATSDASRQEFYLFLMPN